MDLIEFKDLPNTDTPINSENLNLLQNNIKKEIDNLIIAINKAKTIVLNGKWMNGISSFGGDTRIRIPIFNPKNTEPTITNFSGQFYDENTSSWKNVTNIMIATYNTTYIELSMKTDVVKNGVLLRLYGTIQAE